VGVRVIADGRLGYAHAADPSIDEVRATVARARENAAVASPDPFNALPTAEPIEPLDGLFSEALAGMSTDQKVPIALEMERAATTMDPRVGRPNPCATATRWAAPRSRRPRACGSSTRDRLLGRRGHARRAGRRHADGVRVPDRPDVEELDHESVVAEAVERAARMLGATKPATAACRSCSIPSPRRRSSASSRTGCRPSPCRSSARCSPRSWANRSRPMCSHSWTTDGARRPRRGAVRRRGGADPADRARVGPGAAGFLHNTYTALRGGTRSTGNAVRGYRSSPGVGTTNLFVEPGDRSLEQLCGRRRAVCSCRT
jgi:PmbA protein